MTLPKTCQNCKTWPCQTDLQQVLIRRQECEASEALQCLWAWWVFQKLVRTPSERGDPWWRMAFSMGPPCQKGCRWRIAPGCMGCTEQRSTLFSLPLWRTHPVSFLSPLLGRTRRLPPTQAATPRCKEEVLELLSSSALSQLCHVQITLRCWRSTGVHKRCHSTRRARCCTL